MLGEFVAALVSAHSLYTEQCEWQRCCDLVFRLVALIEGWRDDMRNSSPRTNPTIHSPSPYPAPPIHDALASSSRAPPVNVGKSPAISPGPIAWGCELPLIAFDARRALAILLFCGGILQAWHKSAGSFSAQSQTILTVRWSPRRSSTRPASCSTR